MKKIYMKPTMQVVMLRHQSHILQNSPFNLQGTTISRYSSTEDKITDDDDLDDVIF